MLGFGNGLTARLGGWVICQAVSARQVQCRRLELTVAAVAVRNAGQGENFVVTGWQLGELQGFVAEPCRGDGSQTLLRPQYDTEIGTNQPCVAAVSALAGRSGRSVGEASQGVYHGISGVSFCKAPGRVNGLLALCSPALAYHDTLSCGSADTRGRSGSC